MKITTTSKVVAAVVGFSMALTAFAAVGATAASAQTSSMSLTQLVNLFIQLGIISPDKAQAALAAVNSAAPAVSFTKDLTVGSSGAEVTALQNAIGVSPATGYFGSITKAAVIAYQTAHGVPGTGYVGPLTRAALNQSSSMTSSTSSTSTSSSTTSTASTATTPAVNTGVEGILTVNSAPVSNSTLYVGQSGDPVLAFTAQAKLSPISIQRVQLDLGNTTTIYTKVFKTMYLLDPNGNVLAQADLNSNTVVKSGSDYLLTFSGFNYNLPKDAQQTFTVTGDLYSAIDSDQQTARTITLATNGVRGVDGAGIDQYGPASDLTQSVTISASLVDSAQLLLSTDAANFLPADVVAASGSNDNQYDKLPLLAFDVRAQKDTVEITDLTATINGTGVATATAAYLYDGSTLLGSASVNANTGVASFTNINYWVPQDTTKVLTLKADIRSAGSSVSTFKAVVAASGPSAQNSQGSTVNPSGSATGNTFNVRSVGPVFTLNSASISKSATASQNNYSTSTADATFNLTIQAVGGDIYFGQQAASSTFGFGIYENGVKTTITDASSTAWSVPSNGAVTTGLTNAAFKISQNNSVTMPIDFIFEGRTSGGSLVPTASYAVGLESVNWSTTDGGASNTSNFMSGQTAWRTSAVSLP
ncbi:MAG: peptidoglycan-binding protein [Patescibacteria group bacterium]|nr:peptidoglycan-binding protein [Patescibacteria group bacterium]MDE2116589.1 peptidoglycan-binding protein [Patescibacteria group bacterium]